MRPGVVDLTTVMGPDMFDDVLHVVEYVVASSESLALDNAADRATLLARLLVALGALPEPSEARDPIVRDLWERWLRTQPRDVADRLRRDVQ